MQFFLRGRVSFSSVLKISYSWKIWFQVAEPFFSGTEWFDSRRSLTGSIVAPMFSLSSVTRLYQHWNITKTELGIYCLRVDRAFPRKSGHKR